MVIGRANWQIMVMTRTAFLIGGTGQIGMAVARDLLAHGWQVRVGARGHRGVPGDLIDRGLGIVAVDREDTRDLARALGEGADALIDIAAYGAAHARQLLDLQNCVGALVVVSSSSVYRDAAGRTLDEAGQNGFPQLPDPIGEQQATVEPGEATYSTRKVALERQLLDAARIPVTVLRPGAIAGPGSIHPREWWFVKRMLDGRAVIPLAFDGHSRFHTSSVANIARLMRVVLDRPASRILNIADPQALSVGEIGAVIGRHMGYTGRLLPVPGAQYPARIGQTPWSVPRPFVLDTGAALAIGYRPATGYAQAVGAICHELRAGHGSGQDWRLRFPILAGYSYDHFDYCAEDAWLSARGQTA
jgi:nucleoside-diphosphate-sugar epimerase